MKAKPAIPADAEKLAIGGIVRLEIVQKVIPYVRMTRRGKWVNKRAQIYLASQKHLAYSFKSQMQRSGYEMLPERTPLKVEIQIVMPTMAMHKSDIDNREKAILDACKGIVFKDDRWIDDLHIWRQIGQEWGGWLRAEVL